MSGPHLEPPVGKTSVLSGPGGQLIYSSEADVRDGLAAIAWAHGWGVETEAPMAGGTRADLKLTSGSGFVYVVELKLALTTRKSVRLGFQQAEGYRRFVALTNPESAGLLIGLEVDPVLSSEYGELYDRVVVAPYDYLLGLVKGKHMEELDDPGRRAQVAAARCRGAASLHTFIHRERTTDAVRRRNGFIERLRVNYPAAAGMLTAALTSGQAA